MSTSIPGLMPVDTEERWTLRKLPFAARLCLAAFLISVGIGYFSALVNLHFQEATPGEMLPTPDDVVTAYSGKSKKSQMERLLVAHPSLPFNGQGSMRSAFTKQRVGGWESARKTKAKAMSLNPRKDEDSAKIDAAVSRDLDGERLAMIAWVLADEETRKKAYEDDKFELPHHLAEVALTPKFREHDHDKPAVKIKAIMESRCARCHCDSVGGAGSQYPLTSYDEIAVYFGTEGGTGKSLPKLALTTHVHLLGFSMLYGLTGLIFALTSYTGWLRVPLAPLPLLAQVVDISFWWLARLDDPMGPMFARLIPVTGGIVGASLGLQLLLSLFDLFGKGGKLVLTLLIVAVVGGGSYPAYKGVTRFLEQSKSANASHAEDAPTTAKE